jgi:MAC/Perforin domain
MTTIPSDSTTILVTIQKSSTGTNQALLLDPESKLVTTRHALTEKKLMSINDSFLRNASTVINRDYESLIALSAILQDGNVLSIGQATPTPSIEPKDDVSRYNLLNNDQKLDIFRNIQVFRGLSFGSDTFGKTFENVYEWAPGYTPVANNPHVISELVSDYAFTKATSELKTYSSRSKSISVSAPYASGSAEYKTAKSKTTSSSKVTEYLNTKYIVRKVDLQVDPQQLVVLPAFVKAVGNAMSGLEGKPEGYYKLIQVLDKFGYYVPQEFTLGGAILGTDNTDISEFSEAETQKREFNGAFKREFDKMGGGSAYDQSKGKEKSTSTSTKFQTISIRAIGGAPGLEKDYPSWAKSLDRAVNWALADVSLFRPTLVLLAQSDEGGPLLGTAIHLIEKFCHAPGLIDRQPFLDMGEYNTAVQGILNPFG